LAYRTSAAADSRTWETVPGADESAEFLRQIELIRKAWGKDRVPVCEALPGLHHFTILEALAQPGHRLHQLALRQLGLAA